MFHYSNIHSFATAFENMKLHSHPAIKGCVLLLLHAKNFTEVSFLSLSLQNKHIQTWQNGQVGNVNQRMPTQQTFEQLFVLMAKCSSVKNQHLSQLYS